MLACSQSARESCFLRIGICCLVAALVVASLLLASACFAFAVERLPLASAFYIFSLVVCRLRICDRCMAYLLHGCFKFVFHNNQLSLLTFSLLLQSCNPLYRRIAVCLRCNGFGLLECRICSCEQVLGLRRGGFCFGGSFDRLFGDLTGFCD